MNISLGTIEVALQNILIKHDAHGCELEYWVEQRKEKISNSNSKIIQRAITKEYDGLIESYKHESLNSSLASKTLKNIASIIKSYWLTNDDSLYSNLFKCLLNSSFHTIEENRGIGFASFDYMELLGYQVLEKILTTHIFLEKYKNNRFTQNKKAKEDKIKTLNKSLIIAKNHNNQYLVNEINNMINLIKNEDYITKEIIYKNCFYDIHKTLNDKGNFWNNAEALAKETKAKNIANQILEDFFMLNVQYKPSKKQGKKNFFELGSDKPRTFYYYLSR